MTPSPGVPKDTSRSVFLEEISKKRIRDEMFSRLCPEPLYFLITVERLRGPTHLIGRECWCVAGAQRRVCLLIGSCLATVCFMLNDITGCDWCSQCPAVHEERRERGSEKWADKWGERERERGEQGFVRLDHDSRRGVITIITAQFNALNKEIDATPTARSLFESVSVCTWIEMYVCGNLIMKTSKNNVFAS